MLPNTKVTLTKELIFYTPDERKYPAGLHAIVVERDTNPVPIMAWRGGKNDGSFVPVPYKVRMYDGFEYWLAEDEVIRRKG